MLPGLKSQVDSMFPSIRDLTPDENTLEDGEKRLKFGRVVRISDYHTEIFDMHVAKDRNAYTRRMLDLSQRAQIGTIRILVHDRQTMQRKDGSTGWFSYLEWMEYDRSEQDAEKTPESKEN